MFNEFYLNITDKSGDPGMLKFEVNDGDLDLLHALEEKALFQGLSVHIIPAEHLDLKTTTKE